MDEVMLNRLKLLSAQIENLSNSANTISLSDKNLCDAEVLQDKLMNLLKRFNEDLNNYFRMAEVPAADDISEMSEIQLRAEENLSELTIKIKLFTKTQEDRNPTPVINAMCRLPKLNLPEFDGQILNWHQFWDQFQSNIHDRNISDVDKLLYLKSSIKGEAKKDIEGFETTNKNYAIAIQTLKERYGKTSHLIDAHYSALNKISTADATIASCRKTFNELEKHLRVLESLGEDVNHNHLRHLLFEKFPEDLVYELTMKLEGDSIHEIRRKLEKIITAREDANRVTIGKSSKDMQNYTVETLHVTQGNPPHNKHKKMRYNARKGNKPVERNLQPTFKERQGHNLFKRRYDQREENKNKGKEEAKSNTSDNNEEEPKRKRTRLSCIFCKGTHHNDKCDKYKTVNQRRSQLKPNSCFGCFRVGHHIKTCRSNKACWYCKKRRLHNSALCPQKFSNKTETTTLSTVSAVNGRGLTVLQTAIATARKVKDDSTNTNCRILFDSGSQRSYITRKLAQELKLEVEEEESLSVYTFGSKTPQEFDSPVVKLELQTRSEDGKIIYANVVPMISQGVPYIKELEDWKDKQILADDGSLSNKVDILIGNDYYHTFFRTKKIEIKENLYLIESEFGWILSGRLDTDPKEEELSVVTYFQAGVDTKLNRPDLPIDQGNVTFLWELESIGITDSPKASRDEEAVNNFNQTTEIINNRYHVSWPWNEYPPSLTPNYGLAYGRLVNLLKRLDKETLKIYDDTIREQISKGIIEEVPSITQEVDHPVHYLPHHCVAQKGKPIRIVYDASSKVKGSKSLNECLYCGPLMLEDLTRLLIRFRSHHIALSADVEKAFLQIALHEKDRDVTRFLWVKNIKEPPNKDNLVCVRFCRVPFGIISSPFLLNATIKHHLSKGNEQMKKIAKDIYVDNLVTGVQTEGEALQLYRKSKEAFDQISMNLREWSSNCRHFMNKVPDASKETIVKILGLDWHLQRDTLQMRFKLDTNVNSKREVLKVIASVYDPCGFVVPHLLSAKMFLQELWKDKIKWDTTLPMEKREKWSEIQKDLEDVKEVSIPRCYIKNTNVEGYSLHCFTDASLKAYAAVVYITQGIKRNFVIGKSRLVPIKDQEHLKIPRLELLGVLIGSRLIKLVHDALDIEIQHQILWTDSQIVIEWYQSNKLLPPFVARRIEEIKKNKELAIKYVPTDLNPADVATRPCSSVEDKERWLSGPPFLSKGPRDWPSQNIVIQSFLLSTPEGLPKSVQDQPMLVDSSSNEKDKEERVPLNTIREIKNLQAEHFPQEVAGKETDLSRNLKLFKDVDGILRCRGRLQNADLSFDKRYPILIPKDSDFTNNLIKKIHCDNYHVGVNHTLSLIRQTYWIPQGKTQVQKLLRKCPRCVKHGGGPFKLPPTPALPAERVCYSEPFTFVGIDYMGPLLVKGNQKRWICLFTCLAVRAVHLELVQDLTAVEGLLALRRMIACRGKPKVITSDNATHFKLLSEILSDQYCVDSKIHWKFIPQLAPWFGGFYERLIGIVKNCMKRTLGKHMLSDNQLATVLKEIEAVVNTRPLTCVDAELETILKPSDFLTIGRCITMEASCEDFLENGTAIKVDLIKSWKKGLIILQEFKDMFINRYLI